MRATGVVVEHNPFHNGHLYHIKESRKNTGSDVVIAVMSGNFLQRGEPALVDKWSRTKMALQGGVDIVIELPYVFATAQASDFAKGSIALLEAAGCTDFCFGSEQGSIEPFINTYDLITSQQESYQQSINQFMKTGMSYPKALNEAYADLIKGYNQPFVDLSQPNNILGYHYIEAAYQLQASIQPVTIQRIVSGYHDDVLPGQSIASATGIRKVIFNDQGISDLTPLLPKASLQNIVEWQLNIGSFGSWQHFYPYLRFQIIRSSIEQLASYAEVTEGIEYLLKEAAQKSNTFETFMEVVKSKRYTWTRIQRMLTHIYTGFTWDDLKQSSSPTYLRLLGMTEMGQRYLNEHKKNLSLPLVSRVGAVKDSMLSHDIKATDLYTLGIQSHAFNQPIGRDYRQPPIR
ncbi:nucleotidyltransferase [Paenisporosarcina quisquiliarum]|uniref:nucleotidyltransferase n=1 Tax=Paenisporosarcina quisquiliarum TaxID=365346 RepID=UPI0037369F32